MRLISWTLQSGSDHWSTSFCCWSTAFSIWSTAFDIWSTVGVREPPLLHLTRSAATLPSPPPHHTTPEGESTTWERWADQLFWELETLPIFGYTLISSWNTTMLHLTLASWR
jgi:hypothetical protein